VLQPSVAASRLRSHPIDVNPGAPMNLTRRPAVNRGGQSNVRSVSKTRRWPQITHRFRLSGIAPTPTARARPVNDVRSAYISPQRMPRAVPSFVPVPALIARHRSRAFVSRPAPSAWRSWLFILRTIGRGAGSPTTLWPSSGQVDNNAAFCPEWCSQSSRSAPCQTRRTALACGMR
jgi:hypothetical protein